MAPSSYCTAMRQRCTRRRLASFALPLLPLLTLLAGLAQGANFTATNEAGELLHARRQRTAAPERRARAREAAV